MSDPLTLVPIDIETTGLDADAPVTTVGFELELGCRVFVVADRPADELAQAVEKRVGCPVVVSTHADEAALLTATGAFVRDRLADDDALLVGYNAETFAGGFDLPHLRTRCGARDVPWLFPDLPYADILPLVTQRFNTGVADGDAGSGNDDGDDDGNRSRRDLDGVYEILCDGDAGAWDPFADSAAAVTAFEEGDYATLAAHNVADLVRTGDLGRVAQRYCSKSDFQLKSLTPTVAPDSGRDRDQDRGW